MPKIVESLKKLNLTDDNIEGYITRAKGEKSEHKRESNKEFRHGYKLCCEIRNIYENACNLAIADGKINYNDLVKEGIIAFSDYIYTDDEVDKEKYEIARSLIVDAIKKGCECGEQAKRNITDKINYINVRKVKDQKEEREYE